MPSAIQTLLSQAPVSDAAVAEFLKAHTFPIVEGRHATFVYQGAADAVHLRHWVYGLASSQSFHRVEGTQLWHHTLELPPQSRVEYKFEIIQGGQHQWIRDPLNPNLAHDPFGANSVCAGQGYRRPAWTEPDPEARQGTIREMLCASIDVVIQAARLRDGSRRITHVTEVMGMEGDTIITQDIFLYDLLGEDLNGNIIGRHRSTGIGRPRFWERARYYGEEKRLAAALDAAEVAEAER